MQLAQMIWTSALDEAAFLVRAILPFFVHFFVFFFTRGLHMVLQYTGPNPEAKLLVTVNNHYGDLMLQVLL